MASPAAIPNGAAETPFTRRMYAEAALLGVLAARNPRRLSSLTADDCTLRITLSGTPALGLDRLALDVHRLRLEYPRFFPAVPLELYLETPVFHPNVHPETGFVCLWDRHRAAHTAEDALHKTAAILGWKLLNLRPEHTMQAAAAALAPKQREDLMEQLYAAPLLGVCGAALYPVEEPAMRRRRLS